jgi:hypothetical protein
VPSEVQAQVVIQQIPKRLISSPSCESNTGSLLPEETRDCRGEVNFVAFRLVFCIRENAGSIPYRGGECRDIVVVFVAVALRNWSKTGNVLYV